ALCRSLSYVTGMSGSEVRERTVATGSVATSTVADVDQELSERRWTMVTGSLLLIDEFTLVFVSVGGFIGWLGDLFMDYAEPITRVLGALTIVLGLAFT